MNRVNFKEYLLYIFLLFIAPEIYLSVAWLLETILADGNWAPTLISDARMTRLAFYLLAFIIAIRKCSTEVKNKS